ncbi:MAG: tetratricopeptide repeat protein [Cyanobacteria bacterium RUI128]|nr:tetratricopeptide repeat protein [Cyanobacteria bacterium RUI128]
MSSNNTMTKIKKVSAEVDDFISKKRDIFDSGYDDIIERYNALSFELINLEDLPEEAAKYLTKNDYETVIPPAGYSTLACMDKLAKYAHLQAKKKITECLKSDNIGRAVEIYARAIKSGKKNSDLLYLFEKTYTKRRLYSELLELYKIIFSCTYDTKSFEKIGDTYAILKDYEKAIEYYLNVVELTGQNPKIFLKLAKIFKELNDMESYNTCMMQAQGSAGVNEL